MIPTAWTARHPDDDFGLPFSNVKYSATLASSTDTSLTVPGSAQRWKALIKYETTEDVWVALNETAEVPAGGSFATTTSELLPACREVKAGDVLHFFATGTPVVSVVFYSY